MFVFWMANQVRYDGKLLVDYSWIGFAVALGDLAFAGMTGGDYSWIGFAVALGDLVFAGMTESVQKKAPR